MKEACYKALTGLKFTSSSLRCFITTLDGQLGTGPMAIFHGGTRYDFELVRQRQLVTDYAEPKPMWYSSSWKKTAPT